MKYMQHSSTITTRVARKALVAIVESARLGRFPGRRRGACKIVPRRLHSTAGECDSGESQTHLAAGNGGEQSQVIAVADVPDTKHAAAHLPQAHPERQVESLEDESSQRVG